MAHSARCNTDAAAAVIFARLPIPGQAKTRLAAGVGAENAAEFYRRMAEGTFSATARCTLLSSRTLFYSEASESDGISRWMARCEGEGEGEGGAGVNGAPHGMRMRTASQCTSRDLGDRMRHALNHALTHGGPGGGPCDKAVVVGTDIPDVEAHHLDTAVRLLDRHDVVFGPAADGGYYLLGVKRRRGGCGGGDGGDRDGVPGGVSEKTKAQEDDVEVEDDGGGAHPALFAGIPWSTGTVLADSVAAARRAGLSVAPYQSRGHLCRPAGDGDNGDNGDNGNNGDNGESRDNGDSGASGVSGDAGDAGVAGDNSPGLPVLQDIDTVDDLAAWMNERGDGSGRHPLRDAAADLLRVVGRRL